MTGSRAIKPMKRYFPAILVLVFSGFAMPGMAADGDLVSKDAAVRIALRENETIRAARAQWASMKEKVPQERAWEDPMVGIDLQRNGTTRLDKVTDAEYMLSQTLPISGKNLSRGRAAAAEARSAFEELRRAELDVITRVQIAYFRLAGARGQLEINRSNQELLTQFADITRQKYEVGTATQADVLMAETEHARLGEGNATIQRDISDFQTQLNVLMNRSASAALNATERLRFEPPRLDLERAQALAAHHRPELLMAVRRIESRSAQLQLAHRQWIPDPQVRIAARQFSGMAGVQEYDTGVIFSLPWVNYRKYSAGVREAEAGVVNAHSQFGASRTETGGLVRDQFRKIETFASNFRLFDGKILPTATLAMKSTRSGYEIGKNTFLELLTAQRTLREIESSALNQLAEHQVAIAELDAVIGVSPYLEKAKETSK